MSFYNKVRYRVDLSYNGKNYHGWQVQPNAITVQQVLNDKFSIILKEKIELTGAGRTDTGVSASFYTAHFDIENPVADIKSVLKKLNDFLPPDIALFDMCAVDDSFNARFSAKLRTYQYFIHTHKDPFINNFSLFLKRVPDVDKMNTACDILKTFNDYKSFQKAGSDNKSTICNVSQAYFQQTEHKIIFTISADRFLRNMVRAIVGTMIEIGAGVIPAEQLYDIFEAENRSAAGMSVPAHALFLTDIQY